MASKKQYYKLDDIGFVGTQEKKSAAEVEREDRMTVQFFKKRKAEREVANSAKTTIKAVRAS